MLTVDSFIHEDGNRANKWKVVGFLGRGTCCEVYEVQSERDKNLKAALKIYKHGLKYARAHDEEILLLDLVSRASGPCKYLVKTITDFDFDENPCLVQELLDLDLRQLVAKVQGQTLSMFLIQRITGDILRGLQHLHKSGFVHADLKPTNVMWSPDNYCMKIIDYSLSYHVQDKSVGLLQSQGYRAPEAELWNAYCTATSGGLLPNPHTLTYTLIPEFARPTSSENGIVSDGTDLVTSDLVTSDLVTSDLVTSDLVTSDLVTSDPVTSDPVTSKQLEAPGLGSVVNRPATRGQQECSVPGRAADVWSVGCLVLDMVWGAKVFTADKLTLIHKKQTQGVCLTDCLSHVVDSVFEKVSSDRDSVMLKEVVNSCLCIDPKQRWTAEQALQHDLFKTKYEPSFQDLCVLQSTVIRLLNVVECHDLTDTDSYNDLQSDLQDECKKYGDIIKCVIPRSGPGSGKVFLQYRSWKQAQVAYTKLCQRLYNNHNVIVSYFSVDDFNSGNYF